MYRVFFGFWLNINLFTCRIRYRKVWGWELNEDFRGYRAFGDVRFLIVLSEEIL